MKNHTLATFILLAAMPLAVPAAEPAQEAGRSAAATSPAEAPPMFRELDKNHDGHISPNEAKHSADVSARFSAIDTDKNKQISLPEWLADEKSKPRGAAGVSGESREQGDMKKPSPAPGAAGETRKSKPSTGGY